jgi:branched-subunit amino acid transport protein
MSTLALWLTIAGAGAVTFALRLSFIAGLVAALIAWRTRSVLFTLGGGMAALWTLQAVGQSL